MGGKTYPNEKKRAVVAELLRDKPQIATLARKHHISDAAIHSWVKDQRYNPELNNPKEHRMLKPNGHDIRHTDLLIDLVAKEERQETPGVPARLHDQDAFETLTQKIAALENEILFLRKTCAYFSRQCTPDEF